MKSSQGDSLGLVTLQQNFTGVVAASPVNPVECIKRGITTVQCVVIGTATIIWKDGTTQTPVAFIAGQENSIERDSMTSFQVLTGTFNFGTDKFSFVCKS